VVAHDQRQLAPEVGGQRLDVVEVHRVGVSALPVNSDDNLRLPLAGLAEVSDRFDPTTSPANLFRGLPGRARAGRRRPPPARGAAPRADLGTRLAWLAAVGLLLVISDHVYGGTTSSAARRRSPPS
jgi:hypothetical protein